MNLMMSGGLRPCYRHDRGGRLSCLLFVLLAIFCKLTHDAMKCPLYLQKSVFMARRTCMLQTDRQDYCKNTVHATLVLTQTHPYN